jgi:hypothetical protein
MQATVSNGTSPAPLFFLLSTDTRNYSRGIFGQKSTRASPARPRGRKGSVRCSDRLYSTTSTSLCCLAAYRGFARRADGLVLPAPFSRPPCFRVGPVTSSLTNAAPLAPNNVIKAANNCALPDGRGFGLSSTSAPASTPHRAVSPKRSLIRALRDMLHLRRPSELAEMQPNIKPKILVSSQLKWGMSAMTRNA